MLLKLRNHKKFEIDRTIITCLNLRYGRIDPRCRTASLLSKLYIENYLSIYNCRGIKLSFEIWTQDAMDVGAGGVLQQVVELIISQHTWFFQVSQVGAGGVLQQVVELILFQHTWFFQVSQVGAGGVLQLVVELIIWYPSTFGSAGAILVLPGKSSGSWRGTPTSCWTYHIIAHLVLPGKSSGS